MPRGESVLLLGVAGVGAWLLYRRRQAQAAQTAQTPQTSWDAPAMTGGETGRSGPVVPNFLTTPFFGVSPGPQTSQSQGTEWPYAPKIVHSVPALLAGEQGSWPLGLGPSPLIRTAKIGGVQYQTVPNWTDTIP